MSTSLNTKMLWTKIIVFNYGILSSDRCRLVLHKTDKICFLTTNCHNLSYASVKLFKILLSTIRTYLYHSYAVFIVFCSVMLVSEKRKFYVESYHVPREMVIQIFYLHQMYIMSWIGTCTWWNDLPMYSLNCLERR